MSLFTTLDLLLSKLLFNGSLPQKLLGVCRQQAEGWGPLPPDRPSTGASSSALEANNIFSTACCVYLPK